jgi:hypothetical protein
VVRLPYENDQLGTQKRQEIERKTHLLVRNDFDTVSFPDTNARVRGTIDDDLSLLL